MLFTKVQCTYAKVRFSLYVFGQCLGQPVTTKVQYELIDVSVMVVIFSCWAVIYVAW